MSQPFARPTPFSIARAPSYDIKPRNIATFGDLLDEQNYQGVFPNDVSGIGMKHVVQKVGNTPLYPHDLPPSPSTSNDGRFQKGNSMSSNRAKRLGYFTIPGIGSIRVYNKPKNRSTYKLTSDGQVIREPHNSAPIMIFDGKTFYGTQRDIHNLSENGVFAPHGHMPASSIPPSF